MRIRFRETLPSANPEFPFRVGQIIHLPHLTADMQRWLTEGRVEILGDEPEAAVEEPAVERAIEPRARGRR